MREQLSLKNTWPQDTSTTERFRTRKLNPSTTLSLTSIPERIPAARRAHPRLRHRPTRRHLVWEQTLQWVVSHQRRLLFLPQRLFHSEVPAKVFWSYVPPAHLQSAGLLVLSCAILAYFDVHLHSISRSSCIIHSPAATCIRIRRFLRRMRATTPIPP